MASTLTNRSSDGSRRRQQQNSATARNSSVSSNSSAGMTNHNSEDDSFSFDNLPNSNHDDDDNNNNNNNNHNNTRSTARKNGSGTSGRISPKALSMSFMKSLSGLCCRECGNKDPMAATSTSTSLRKHLADGKERKTDDDDDDDVDKNNLKDAPSELYNLQALQRSSSSISPLVTAPMMMALGSSSNLPVANNNTGSAIATVEGMIGEYMCLCQFYKVPYNAGIVTTLRFSLPSLRVSGSFHDLDMLALTELLLRHANARLSYLTRLDFTMASIEGKRHQSYKFGFTSHGALALAKTLQKTRYIQQVWLPRHRIGPYGASALFLACRDNPTIHTLNLRRCRIGERGAFAFCELISGTPSTNTTATMLNDNLGLQDVDLGSNGIGNQGTVAIERALQQRAKASGENPIFVNLEGNLVFPEIMNGITHGLGIVLSLIGGYMLSDLVKNSSMTHRISCAIYTTSLLALYVSSTLFHSFFALQNTKYVFQVFDKCAIYVLIAGSYTPFLQIILGDQAIWSIGLLGFIWMCCFFGISVEAFAPTWKFRPMFSLMMYLGMGWAAMICVPQMKERLEQGCINFLILGGVGYTVGVPFFVRDNNLDHSIWHLFVLSGSIFHWLAIYMYVAPTPLSTVSYTT